LGEQPGSSAWCEVAAGAQEDTVEQVGGIEAQCAHGVSVPCPAFEAAVRITLINPGQLSDAGEDQFAGRMDTVFFRLTPFSKTYFGIPLALPTLAGATPAKHSVRIVDEMVETVDFADGSLIAMGLVANLVSFCTFSRSEQRRLKADLGCDLPGS
jgi:hypothetical protein